MPRACNFCYFQNSFSPNAFEFCFALRCVAYLTHFLDLKKGKHKKQLTPCSTICAASSHVLLFLEIIHIIEKFTA